MSNAYQRAAVRRKFIYFGVIVALFMVTIFVRGLVAMPLPNIIKNQLPPTIANQADQLEMTERSQGDTELTGSAIRLLLTGSRGLAICGLWISASEYQAKQEWNQLDLVVRSITKLQPHFMTPWLFQSWNLAYNVSVEMDNLGDMYFYIARGIGLLAEGESINRYNPKMRHTIGFYYQNKFGVSDKVTTLRCLLQLSSVPPAERDLSELLKGNDVQPKAFEEFCRNNPRLIRKLREMPIRIGKNKEGRDDIQYLCQTPKSVTDFLRKHQEVLETVSRYRDRKELHERYLQQFPVLPMPFSGGQDELRPDLRISDADADAHLVARAWYTYANEAVPLPDPVPGPTPTNYVDPEHKRRVPSDPMLIIFRQGPQRAQTYVAEFLAKEGWFDKDPWIMDQGIELPKDRWFPNAPVDQPVKLEPVATAKLAWAKAFDMWDKLGSANGLYLTDAMLEYYTSRAREYAELMGRPLESQPDPMRPSDKENPRLVEGFNAQKALFFYRQNLHVTQFDNFYHNSLVEQKDETIAARKLFYQAEKYRLRQLRGQSIKTYEAAFDAWKKILASEKRFRAMDRIMEETYEYEIKYQFQLRERDLPKLIEKSRSIVGVLAPVALLPKPRKPEEIQADPQGESTPLIAILEPFWFDDGPMDGLDPQGKPWIPEHLRVKVKQALNLMSPAKPTGPPPRPGGPGGQGGPPGPAPGIQNLGP